MSTKKIDIFVAGSTDRYKENSYYDAAVQFGKLLDSNKHRIIFDGCLGIPGLVAEQYGKYSFDLAIACTYNRHIYNDWPCASINGTFRNQSEVTRAFLDWSDVLVFFKGDYETLAELFHAIDTKKNGEHDKPIIIVNIDNEWNDLIMLLKNLKNDNFYYIAKSPQEIIDYIENTVELDRNCVHYKK